METSGGRSGKNKIITNGAKKFKISRITSAFRSEKKKD